FDAVSGAGVLRMTTLQFTLPSGKPLQQLSLLPDIALPLPPPLERESSITRQPISFDGPDVRDRARPGPAWPSARGAIGPCRDPLVCRAISQLSKHSRGRGPGADATESRPRAARPRPGSR